VTAGNVDEIARLLHNRLQPAERLCPEVTRWRQRLTDLGPAGQMMSGSGSTVFALCRDPVEALRLSGMLTQALASESLASGSPRGQCFLVRSCV